MNYIKIKPPKDRLKYLYIDKEKTLKEIGIIFNCSGCTIRKRLLEIGIKMRKPAHLGQTDKTKRKLSKIRKGTKLSSVTKKKIIKWLTGKFGRDARNWKGGRTVSDGYVLIRDRNHKNSRDNYIGEHILVMEKKIRRYLKKGEVVHHKNKNRSDNRIENLFLFKNQNEHVRYHNLNK